MPGADPQAETIVITHGHLPHNAESPTARSADRRFSAKFGFRRWSGSRRTDYPLRSRCRRRLVLPRLFLGEGVEFGGYVSGLGRADALEDFLCLPQAGLRVSGTARG
jgi:hypothetical protein